MEQLTAEIRSALEIGAYTLALHGALAAIDICGGLPTTGRTDRGARFRDWFEDNLPEYAETISAKDVWAMRCGVLHQGRIDSKDFEAILFTLEVVGMHNVVMGNALMLHLPQFVGDIADAVDRWWRANRDVEPVKTNRVDMMRIRPAGMRPYLDGAPLMA
jgi:hypothetical protein